MAGPLHVGAGHQNSRQLFAKDERGTTLRPLVPKDGGTMPLLVSHQNIFRKVNQWQISSSFALVKKKLAERDIWHGRRQPIELKILFPQQSFKQWNTLSLASETPPNLGNTCFWEVSIKNQGGTLRSHLQPPFTGVTDYQPQVSRKMKLRKHLLTSVSNFYWCWT